MATRQAPPRWGTVIVAAGNGLRFGSDRPKQYALLGGRAVLARAIDALRPHGAVVVVANPEHGPLYGPVLAPYGDIRVVAGGATRQDSVRAGLRALADMPAADVPGFVMVHDAARPLIDAASIERLIRALEAGGRAATLAVPLADTLLRGSEVVDRAGVHAVQTPQAFAFDLLCEAHEKGAGKAYTDDTTLVRGECGVECELVEGDPDNFKITRNADLDRAEKRLMTAYADTRTGLGYDVHRFGPPPAGGCMRLLATDIPCDRSLLGHSDADAGLHAIADAILGTIGAGDIGVHFPPSDPSLRGMDSARIVQKALALLHERDGYLAHVDVMLMAQAPRVNARRETILANLSALLGLPADRIGLKATTTEGLGFIGRVEGLAVQALATVRLKR